MIKNADDKDQLKEKVIEIRRVSKKAEGGNRYSFTALVVAGDRKGRVGMGFGRAPDVRSAVSKAGKKARDHLFEVPIKDGTIPFAVEIRQGAVHMILRPASPGVGIAVGGPARVVAELSGIRDISGKVLGTRNKLSNVKAVFKALEEIKRLAEKYGK